MKSYKQFINEGKNTHLEHLEDELWNEGSAGVENALRFVGEVASMLSGNSDSSINITTKWDGAPAIFCGINPENKKFFVGTKSVFNVGQPKINYTNADIDKNHSGGLASKLKIALKHLSSLKIRGVLQGDLMFTKSDVSTQDIDGERYVTFTPNTITYAFKSDSDTAKKIKSAKIGIVFHTEYKGRKMSGMQASFNPNINRLGKSKDVWYRDASFVDESGTATLTSSEHSDILSLIEDAESKLSASSDMIEELRGNSALIPMVKTYFNSIIKVGSSKGNHSGLIDHVSNKYDTDINKLKSDAGKERKTKVKEEMIKYIEDRGSEIDDIFELHSLISEIKIKIVRKLESIESVSTFVRTDNGFRTTSPEGFVAVDKSSDNKALKFVDRLEFSRSNFTVAKNWIKG